jgi:hypothetical protein
MVDLAYMKTVKDYFIELNKLNAEIQILSEMPRTGSINNRMQEILKEIDRVTQVIWISTVEIKTSLGTYRGTGC